MCAFICICVRSSHVLASLRQNRFIAVEVCSVKINSLFLRAKAAAFARLIGCLHEPANGQ